MSFKLNQFSCEIIKIWAGLQVVSVKTIESFFYDNSVHLTTIENDRRDLKNGGKSKPNGLHRDYPSGLLIYSTPPAWELK